MRATAKGRPPRLQLSGSRAENASAPAPAAITAAPSINRRRRDRAALGAPREADPEFWPKAWLGPREWSWTGSLAPGADAVRRPCRSDFIQAHRPNRRDFRDIVAVCNAFVECAGFKWRVELPVWSARFRSARAALGKMSRAAGARGADAAYCLWTNRHIAVEKREGNTLWSTRKNLYISRLPKK